MSFKVICTDIDGTLLDSRRQLSDFTIKTFKRIPENVPVILASSRMPSAMTHLQNELGRSHDPLICYNGGYVIHYNGSSQPDVIYSAFIPAEICAGIIALAAGRSIHTSLYFEDEWFAPQWDTWTEREARITKVQPKISSPEMVIANWKNKKVGGHKVMCMGPVEDIQAMEDDLNRNFAEEIHVYRSRPTYLELAPKVISKGSALEILLKRKLSLTTSDVIAFGDNYNDIELLRIAGRGVAVGDARKEVIAVADEITLDSKADGVAVALLKHWQLEN
jgi:Cof subfamily protein (haloacid dehalogenase superfamily)